jgi:hypothetical protein
MKRRDFVQKAITTTGAIAMMSNTAYSFKHLTSKQMTDAHPHIELISAFFKAYATNDIGAIKNIFAEDIKWPIPGTHPLSGKLVTS